MSDDRRASQPSFAGGTIPVPPPSPSEAAETNVQRTLSSDSAIALLTGDEPTAVSLPEDDAPSLASLEAKRAELEAKRAESEGPMSEASRHGRARMTLRIPDDRVERPSGSEPNAPRLEADGASGIIPRPSAPPRPSPHSGPVSVPPRPSPPSGSGPAAIPITAARIITINPPAMAPGAAPIAAAPEVKPVPPIHGKEDSWTPFQPTVADMMPQKRPAVAASLDDGDGRDVQVGPLSDVKLPPSAPSDDIPIVEASPPSDSGEHLDLSPDRTPIVAVPIKPLPPRAPIAPKRSPSSDDIESEEVRFDEEEAVPTVSQPAPVARKTKSAEGDAAEIAPEDLVSVESVPDTSLSSPRLAGIPAAKPSAPTLVSTPPSGPQPAARPAPRMIVPPHASSSPLAPPPMNEAAASRKRARPWWEELFNDDFVRTMAKITDAQIAAEATFIEDSLNVAKGAMVLDLACGIGRHAIELSKRGYQVVGFDLSLAMLARAGDDAQEQNAKINFVQGDMREMTFEDTFDGAYCWNTSFGFFEEEKNAAVIQRVHKALKKGGLFVLDVVNRDFVIRQSPSLAWFEGEGCICMDEMQIDWITSRMKVKRTMMMDDGRTKEIEFSIRVYSLHELGRILHEQGFRVAEVSGRASTPGVFFGSESPRTLILAEKR